MAQIRVTASIAIDEDEIVEQFVRSAGPGGQNVNKVSTAVQIRFDVAGSPSLPEDVRRRLLLPSVGGPPRCRFLPTGPARETPGRAAACRLGRTACGIDGMCTFYGANIDFPEARPEIYGLDSVPSAHRRGEVARLFLSSRISGISDATATRLGRSGSWETASLGERF